MNGLDHVQAFFNPPWALGLLAPVLALPFTWAVAAWIVVNLVLGVACGWLTWRLYAGPTARPPFAWLAVGLLYLPFLECVRIGQLSVLIGAAMLGALVALREERDATAGLLLAVVAVKPHTMLLLLLALLVHVLVTKRWRLACWSCAGTTILVVSSAAVAPGAWTAFLAGNGAAPTYWHSATLVGWFRYLLPGAPLWPMLVIPATALAVMAPAAFAMRWKLRWEWIPFVLGVSYLAAPHGSIYDLTVLMGLGVLAMGVMDVRPPLGRRLLGTHVLVQLSALWLWGQPAIRNPEMILLAFALLPVTVWAARVLAGLPRLSGDGGIQDPALMGPSTTLESQARS
jgi:hypothetical protein